MTEEKTKQYFFSNQDLKKLIVPLIIEQFLTVLVGLADSIMVAKVGEDAVASVSLVDTFSVLLINIFAALATGGAVVAGQFLGKRREKDACLATDQVVLFTTLLGIVVTLLMYLCKNLIIDGVFGQISSAVRYNCNIYFMITVASIPFIALYNAGAAIFRAMGNSKISMLVALLMNAVNVAGNAIMIYVLGYGVEGAAIPTLFSRVLAAVVIILLLLDQRRQLHFSRPFSIRLRGNILKKILYIGIPNGLENSMFQLGKILVLSLIAGFGTAATAANAVGNAIASFMILPGIATGYALLSVTAQCAGAGDYEQVKYYTNKLMKWTYLAFIVSNGLIILVLPLILKVYGLSPEATKIARNIIWLHGICCVTIWAPSFTLPNTLRACNDVKYCMTVSIISMWAVRIGASWILGKFLGWGVFGIWTAMILDWAVRDVFFITHYIGGKWKEKRI